jgi:beta-lactamase regulating signal transducer with metallopeptidase domain
MTEHLIAASIKGILVLITAAALCFALRHASAAARHFVWMLALGGLLALPVLSFSLPVWQIALLPSAPVESGSTAAGSLEFVGNASKMAISPAAPEPMSAGNDRTATSVESKAFDSSARQISAWTPAPAGWVRWAFALWLAGALLIVGRLLIGTASIWWIAHRASRITEAAWLSAAKDIGWQIGLTRRVQMFKTPRITMPVTCGLIRSAILLPADADDWPDERRQVVLAHELAHVRRWDCLTQLLAQTACSIYWFNPLVWLATRQLRIERERACDDQVIYLGTKASEYAGHLLDMARTFRTARCSSLAAVAIARRSELEGRLLAILDPGLKRRGLNRIAAISVGVVTVCVVLTLATMRLSAKAQANGLPRVESVLESEAEPSYHSSVTMPVVQSERRQAEETSQPASGETFLPQSEPVQGDQERTGTPGPTQQKDNSGVVEALREALKDEDPEVRQHALFALTQIGDPQALGALIEALKDQNWQVRAKAAYGLGVRGRQNGIDALVGALKDTSWQVREQAAWGLGLIGDARAIEPLTIALRDESSEVREKAAWALALKGDKRSVEPLMAALKDTSASVRGMAAWALGLKGDPRAANALKDALKDADKGVRQRAAWALGMLLMQRGEAVGGDPDPQKDVETEIESDREPSGVRTDDAGMIINSDSPSKTKSKPKQK